MGLTDEIGVIPGAHDEEAGADAARAMLASPALPTAVLPGNDRCALGILDVFRRAGVDVPAQVSLMGYDDGRLSENPRIDLTTIHQDAPGWPAPLSNSPCRCLSKDRRGRRMSCWSRS